MKTHTEWYRHSEPESLKGQKTTFEYGLSHEEVAIRVGQFGNNKLQDAKRKSAFRILLSQFTDLLVLVLIGAAVIATFLGEPQDALAIVAIIILNSVLGFFQEYRAERAMEALQSLAAPTAKVKRMGQVQTVAAHELVPGDIVFLEAGNIVPADLRILESYQLGVNESMLTGESQPVEKISQAILADRLPVVDQKNMAFKGTLVSAGRAIGVVVEIGASTELGRIAQLLKEEVEVKTPLQNRIANLARKLSIVVIAICALIFAVGLMRGEDPVLMFMTALSLAVAAIPEALPAVVTVTLALGARTMIRKHALVRRLPAVESLGSVTYICTDKTGTLTENRMQAKGFYVNGEGYSIVPEAARVDPVWLKFMKILVLNNDVVLESNGRLQGDPTEIALVEVTLPFYQSKNDVEKELPRIAEIPFSSERGMMSTVHQSKSERILLSKGAPEKILPLCHWQYCRGEVKAFHPELAFAAVEKMAEQGFRVLAVAYRDLKEDAMPADYSKFEDDLVFLGLIGLIDPPREGAKDAITLCKTAGIKVVMITGDHPSTAKTIARDLGLFADDGQKVMTGVELLALTEETLQRALKEVSVYARIAPEEKIKIVKALQASGEIVAMTGDGVNDAPALRRSDVGVSMGKGGTDVAREASHVILLDDNFATIVAAVREGRRIYDNIRKFIRFALSGNSGEIWTLFLAPFLGLPTPLLPIHILWVNLVTDGLPGLALAAEPEEKNIMRRSPRLPNESVFAKGLWQHSVWVGVMTAAATLGTLAWAYHTGHAHWQSMAFTVLTMTQMGHVLAIRSETESFFSLGFRSNIFLTLAVLLTLLLQLGTLYIPVLNRIFKTEPLSLNELLICALASSSVFISVEIEKWIFRRKQKAEV